MHAASLAGRVRLFVFTILLIGLGFCLLQPPRPVHAQNSLGGPISHLTPLETTLFGSGFQQFIKIWDPTQGLARSSFRIRAQYAIRLLRSAETQHKKPYSSKLRTRMRVRFTFKPKASATSRPVPLLASTFRQTRPSWRNISHIKPSAQA